MPEDVCLDELEDSQCLSDDTDTEAASEVGIPWDHLGLEGLIPHLLLLLGWEKLNFMWVSKKKKWLGEVMLIPRHGLIRF